MPKYPRPPDLARTVADIQRRVRSLEARMSQTATAGSGGGSAPAWDTNVVWNGAMESGTTGWRVGFWNGTNPATLSVETANPLDGEASARIDEVDGASATGIVWHPSGFAGSSSGIDCWPTAPGDTWRLSAIAESTTPITLHLRFMIATTPSDIYGIADPNTNWLDAVVLPLAANTPTTLTGQAAVPSGGPAWAYIGCHVQPEIPNAASPYTWWFDDVVMQQKLA